jgi:hypothetical protein
MSVLKKKIFIALFQLAHPPVEKQQSSYAAFA